MNYTGEQVKLLATFEHGRLIQELNEQELVVYRFLMGQELLQPRADIQDGWHLLSERGKIVLLNRRIQQEVIDQEADKLAEQNAKEKKNKASQYRHDFLVALFAAALTIVVEHINEIVNLICSFFH